MIVGRFNFLIYFGTHAGKFWLIIFVIFLLLFGPHTWNRKIEDRIVFVLDKSRQRNANLRQRQSAKIARKKLVRQHAVINREQGFSAWIKSFFFGFYGIPLNNFFKRMNHPNFMAYRINSSIANCLV